VSESIWIDARAAEDPDQRLRGIGRYVAEHTRGLLDLDPGRIAGVICEGDPGSAAETGWLAGEPARRAFDLPVTDPPALYHVMSPFEPLWPRERLWPVGACDARTRVVVTVYDLIPKVLPEYRLSGARASRYEARLQLVRRADQILCISDFTAADVQRVLDIPDRRITVIGVGMSSALDTSITVGAAVEVLRHRFPALRRGFPLYVGGADWRKNLEMLVRAWGATPAYIRRGRPLVICGHMPPDRISSLETQAEASGLTPGELLLTGYISDPELAALYRSCGAFVFPSLYEGSGLPMLEAMAFGLPVVAANTSTTSEILGDLDMTFDPFDAEDMARVISRALGDDEARARLKARSRVRSDRFTWHGVAERTFAGYERALAASPLTAPR
jgi:glycosyltransferase involved in cell wall biosynthesis